MTGCCVGLTGWGHLVCWHAACGATVDVQWWSATPRTPSNNELTTIIISLAHRGHLADAGVVGRARQWHDHHVGFQASNLSEL